MNISIKNIKEILEAEGSNVLLPILSRRANDIDSEIVLLHELKEIVLNFIRQLRQIDFRGVDEFIEAFRTFKNLCTLYMKKSKTARLLAGAGWTGVGLA